jgi:hypothetical protein
VAGLDGSQVSVTRESDGRLAGVSVLRFSTGGQKRSKLGGAVSTQEHFACVAEQYRSVVDPDTAPLAVASAAVLPARQMGGARGLRVVVLGKAGLALPGGLEQLHDF